MWTEPWGASAAASPRSSSFLRFLYYIKSGSRQNDRLPQEMTPVTEGSAANLQASFCLNSLSPCRQILIFSVTASFPPLCCSARFCFAHKMQFLQHLSSSTPLAPPAKPVFSGLKKKMLPPTFIYWKSFTCYFFTPAIFDGLRINILFWLFDFESESLGVLKLLRMRRWNFLVQMFLLSKQRPHSSILRFV